MARLSQRWQDSILQSRNQSCGQSVLDSTFPIMPWITPALDPKLEALILRIGARRNFEPGELLFAKDQKIDQLAIVCRGVTAQGIGNFSQYAVGLATPGRIAAGNLNFFSERHAIGRYFALTTAEVCFCPRSLLLSILRRDERLFMSCVAQFECSALSDRLSFACLFLGDAVLRLKALTATWALNYGSLEKVNGKEWIRMPVPMTIRVRSQVINATSNWVDRIIAGWRKAGLCRREGEVVFVSIQLIEEGYTWLRSIEEADNKFHYPHSIRTLFENR